MRAIWKGAVSFGLVSISVKLYSATEEKDIRFHQVHREDGGRIRYKRVCSVCGEEVSYDDIAKGFDLGGGEMVVLTDEDFANLPLSTSHAVEVLEFVPAQQIDPLLFSKAYYLEPENAATKPYVLLRDALTDSDRVAIVKVALRQREQLATLRVHGGVLVLSTMLWPDEVRTPDFEFLGEDVSVRPQELAMAASLIDSMAADFEPDAYTDNYREALQEVIDAKVSGHEVVAPEAEEAAPSAAVDLMAALRASVERARQARGEPVEPTPITAARSSVQRTSGSEAKDTGTNGTGATGDKVKDTGAKATGRKRAEAAKSAEAKTPATGARAGAKRTPAAAKKAPAKATAAKKSADDKTGADRSAKKATAKKARKSA